MRAQQSWVKLGLAALLAVGTVGSASAAPLEIATGSDYAPYADDKLPDGGLATVLVRKAFAAVNQDVTISFVPWKRGYDGTAKADYAATFPYVPSDERKQVMLYSDPIVEVRQVVFSNKDKPVSFADPDDLKGKTVCAALGYALPDAIDALVKAGAIKREQPQNLDACGKLLTLGRADFLIGDVFTVGAMFNRIGGADKVTVSDQAVNTSSLHLIAARSAPGGQAMIDAFNAGLKALKANGSYDAVLNTARAGS